MTSNPHNLIDNLPNGIEELVLERNFNFAMNNLPTSIKIIEFNHRYFYNYDHELNCLPYSIECLKLSKLYDKKISNIPKGLKKIVCSKDYKFIDDFNNLITETY